MRRTTKQWLRGCKLKRHDQVVTLLFESQALGGAMQLLAVCATSADESELNEH